MVDATKLRAARKALNWTQQELAVRASMALSTVAKFEQGRGRSSEAAVVARLAGALGCDSCSLLTEPAHDSEPCQPPEAPDAA